MKNINIGFIGLGNVGSKLANNLISKNKKIYLFDQNKKAYFNFRKKNVYICKNLQDLANNCKIIITCLPSPIAVKKVINSLLPHISKSHLWIEMSTTDKDEMIRLSQKFNKLGANVIECPITGGEHRAASGNISIFVSGKRKHFNRHSILSKMGHQIPIVEK